MALADGAQPFRTAGSICIVTGGSQGIGLALADALLQRKARHVVLADIKAPEGQEACRVLDGRFGKDSSSFALCDVSREESIRDCIERTVRTHGSVDLFVSNAGILAMGGVSPDLDAGYTNEQWQKVWEINSMSHVWAARHLLPMWKKDASGSTTSKDQHQQQQRRGGHFLVTASAAGLLTQLFGLPYAVTKAASVSIAEWLSITYGTSGFAVSCLCPQAVDTPMTAVHGASVAGVDGVLSAEHVANFTLDEMEKGKFLILPHASVDTYVKRKAEDRDRWILGMRRLSDRMSGPPSKL